MADPVLHVIDSYYFEVPKALWTYESLNEVPEFLKDHHPEATLEEFQHELNGKVLIPQPFGKLKNLYEPESGFCISKAMILQVVVAGILILLFTRLAKRIAAGGPPKGRFWNLFESVLQFIRNEIARPVIGHDADKFLPLIWTAFFFVLTCNLFGLLPWSGTATGSLGTTLALAVIMMVTVFGAGIAKFGPGGFFLNMVPKMDIPIWLYPLKIVIQIGILIIEVFGLVLRHAILAVRLCANMVAGHLVLAGVMGMIPASATGPTGQWALVTVIIVIGSIIFTCLELFIAFLQAYIFVFLSCLFISAAVHHH